VQLIKTHLLVPEAGRSLKELAMGGPQSQRVAVSALLATRRDLGRELLMFAISIVVACFGVFVIVD